MLEDFFDKLAAPFPPDSHLMARRFGGKSCKASASLRDGPRPNHHHQRCRAPKGRAVGAEGALENMEPHHAGICAAAKTARDRKAIAKATRIRKREAGLAPKKRGFSKPEGARYDWARGRYVREG